METGAGSRETAPPDSLRAPPVVGRTRDGWMLLDPRILSDEDPEKAARAVAAASRS